MSLNQSFISDFSKITLASNMSVGRMRQNAENDIFVVGFSAQNFHTGFNLLSATIFLFGVCFTRLCPAIIFTA